MPSYAVIGASRGIGLELVRQLSSSPDNVVFAVARNKSTATHLAALVASTPSIHVLQADGKDNAALKAAASEAARVTGGTLDVLVHSAAHQELISRSFDDYATDDALEAHLTENYHVNVLGLVHSVRAFVPLLRKGAAKKVIVIGSGAGERAFTWQARIAGMAAYALSRAAAALAVTKFAVQLGAEGFAVVTVLPSLTDTSATIANPADMAEVAKLFETIQKALPAVKFAPVAPEVTVARLIKVIDSVGPADNGTIRGTDEEVSKIAEALGMN